MSTGIFQLYRWHQYQPLWDLFSHLRKTLIHSRLEFGSDRTAFYKCHCHRWGWAASGHSSHVWRKVRVNDDRDWQGGLWGWARIPRTTPGSTRDPSGSGFHSLLFSRASASLRRLSASWPLATSEFFGSCWNQGSSFQKSAWASFRDSIFQASSQLFMLWQYPSYSHSTVLGLLLKVILSQLGEEECAHHLRTLAPGSMSPMRAGA